MRYKFLFLFYLIKSAIAYFSRIDISNESCLEYLEAKRGCTGNIEVLIIKVPVMLTIQGLEDNKRLIWKAARTEEIREIFVYYSGKRRFGLCINSVDYQSSPRETFYLRKRRRWLPATESVFDNELFKKVYKSKFGSFATSSTAMIYVLVFLIL